MRRRIAAAAGSAAFFLVLAMVSPNWALAVNPGVTGTACQPGQGVTLAVDAVGDGSDVTVACAVGATGTVAEAFAAAGFTLGWNGPGWLASVDGLDPTAAYGANAYWASYTSTVDGSPAGAPATDWTYASVGLDDPATVTVDQAYLLRVIQDWTAPATDPVPTLADVLAAGATTSPSPSPSPSDTESPAESPSSTPTESPSESASSTPTESPSESPSSTPTTPGRDQVVAPGQPATPGTAQAQAAAAWMASQLSDDVVAHDTGLTIDVLLGIASTGVGADQVRATAQALFHSGSAFIGPADAVATSWPQVAKMALALEVAGLDPTTFPDGGGSRDLLGDLRSVVNTDGSFGAPGSDSVFAHPLAMLALARTSGGVPDQVVTWLQDQQCADGSFGWAPDCSQPDADSTAMAIQALTAAGVASDDPVLTLAQAWLLTQQETNGGFTSLWAGVNTNTTGLAAQALMNNAVQAAAAATGYVADLAITPDTVALHPVLTSADIGAIAADQSGFGNAMTSGLTPAVSATFLRATAQAVFALGRTDLANLTLVGAEAGWPDQTGSGGQPTAEPSQQPGGTPPAANPGSGGGVSAPTGGTVRQVGPTGAGLALLISAAAGLAVAGWAGPRLNRAVAAAAPPTGGKHADPTAMSRRWSRS